METNIILAGVGGQGIVSISFVIDMAALKLGYSFKQAEVHGMSQRGGAVSSHLRVSDKPIHSDLVPRGRGTIVLSVEPLESLRHVDYLSPSGVVVASTDPYVNIDNYGSVDAILEAIAALQSHVLVPSERLARQAGTAKAQNMVMLGAASPYLGLSDESLEYGITEAFARKGERVQNINIAAFRSGRAAGKAYLAMLKSGVKSENARALIGRLVDGTLYEDAVDPWKAVFEGVNARAVIALLSSKTPGLVAGTAVVPNRVLDCTDASDRLAELLFG